jgi:D-beta-D-heptose 7-phosphate kinase/D-beta-D-heptose 1-phosphate adenosyltransferase
MAALACVDAVTLFDEDTPAVLIGALLPDVLVKGGDYAPDQVIGREVVESHGGRLVLIPFISGRSTTALLQRVRTQET